MSKTWTEQHAFEQLADDAIDAENGVIRRVRVLGRESKNRRRYPEAVMRAAIPLYEGRKVKLNHPIDETSERQVQDNFGVLKQVSYQDGAIYADHLFPPTHEYAGSYVDACRRYSTSIGFSHNAIGESTVDDDGWENVEELLEVVSVDLVDSPATNNGIFESKRELKVAKRTIKQVLADSKNSKSTVRLMLLREMEAGVIAPDLQVDGVPEGPIEEPVEQETSIKAAFRSAIMAVFDDDSLDADATMKAIAKILKTHSEVTEGPKETEESGEGEGGEGSELLAATESLRKEIRSLKAEKSCRSLLEKSGIGADDDLVDALTCLSKSQRETMVKKLKTQARDNDEWRRPARSEPIRESFENDEDDSYESAWSAGLQPSK